MRRRPVVALAFLTLIAAPIAAARATFTPPSWLVSAQREVLRHDFASATPRRVDHIVYPRKIAVIFTFPRVVVCQQCSAPSNSQMPRGRIVRVTFDRATHQMGPAIQFCLATKTFPPRALCFRR